MTGDRYAFRQRFNRWKQGERYWSIIGQPLPHYADGKDGDLFYKNLYPKNIDTSEYDFAKKAWNYDDQQAMKFVHDMYQMFPDHYEVYAGELPEVVVKPDPNAKSQVTLTTYYPMVSAYPYTGHSRLNTEGGNIIDVNSNDVGYNLITNNCSDATRKALEIASGKKMNNWFFTTPGDVKDFAELLGGRTSYPGYGRAVTKLDLPTEDVRKIAEYSKKLSLEKHYQRSKKIRPVGNNGQKVLPLYRGGKNSKSSFVQQLETQPTVLQPAVQEWGDMWKERMEPAAKSKVLLKWNATGRKPKPETSQEYTNRRIKETTERTWRSDAADIAHGIGEGVLALNPYTAIPYYGAKVGQDVLSGNVGWQTAVNASIPLFHLSPQPVGLKEATNIALKDAANVVDNTARHVSPSYDLYRTIGETTPRTTPTLHSFYSSDLTGSGFVENVYTGSPLFEFGQIMRTSPEKAYFMRAPKDVDVLKLGNGKFRHEVVGNEVLPSGEVNGKFVSYGEPWQEFALGENSALYKFPVGPRRGPSLMATDWKGRGRKYSVDEVYDYMLQEEALRKELASIKETMGDDFLKQYSTIRRNLINEKYPTLKEHIDTSIYGANQTVIPNEKWNFDWFLKTPFWKYSENPISGQVQKELMMKWPKAKVSDIPTAKWADFSKNDIRWAGSAKGDYSNSGYGILDYLKDNKIKAFLEGKPFYEMDLGPLGKRKESFPSNWTITKMPFSNESKEIINNSAKPRILAQAEKDIRDVYDPTIDGPDIEKYVKDELSYIEKQLDERINEGYELGSDALFKAHDEGKTATRTGGLQLTNNGRIVLREGENPERFAVHEWEHRRTNGNIGGSHYGNEKRLLRKAFTKEFRELSETVPDFKGMNMDDEMVTTVSDTREALIGKTHLRKTAPELQNKMIDKSSDEKIFAAVEKANAYGSFYIQKMRELGKLTPELAQNMREALKHVGAYIAPIGMGYGVYRKLEYKKIRPIKK